MVETIEVGICQGCGVLTASGKLEEVESGRYPGEDDLKCPVCKKISPRYQWEIRDFLVDRRS